MFFSLTSPPEPRHREPHITWRVEQPSWKQSDLLARASVLYKPKLYIDGDMWCVLYGENVQSGCAGFGKSPDLAMADFDLKWTTNLEEEGR